MWEQLHNITLSVCHSFDFFHNCQLRFAEMSSVRAVSVLSNQPVLILVIRWHVVAASCVSARKHLLVSGEHAKEFSVPIIKVWACQTHMPKCTLHLNVKQETYDKTLVCDCRIQTTR